MTVLNTPIAVMICYARSGGTLLNKCLQALPDTMVFSEVSPFRKDGGIPSLKQQALDWYGLSLTADSFTDCVRELHRHCEARGKALVLRDWSFCCFEGWGPDSPPPPDRLVLLEQLPPELPHQGFVFVRDAMDVFLSRPWSSRFMDKYARFARCAKETGFPVFRYERFCKDPEEIMQEICTACGLCYSPDFVRNFPEQVQVTGDVSLGALSRGASVQTITRMPRRLPSPAQARVLFTSQALRTANRTFGYTGGYFSAPLAFPWRRHLK